MKKTTVNAITFAQAKDNTKAVVSDKYVAHALYTQNKPIWEALGGTRIEGEKGLRIEFKSVKNAKEFIAKAITSVNKSEYDKARKTEPKAKVEKKATVPASTKGKVEYVSVTLDDGTKVKVKKSDLVPMDKPTKKAKGKVEAVKPTTAPNTKASKSAKATKTTPRKAKGGCAVDFSALAGKGKAANKEAAALMRKAGYTNGTSDEYKAIWAEWCKVR